MENAPLSSASPSLLALKDECRTWLITGVAGFIGCNLLAAILNLGQRVIGLDNFSTGHRRNLEQIRAAVTPDQWRNFCFIEGDIRELATCRSVCADVDYVLHHAALGSVPRSIEDPITANQNNIDGFLNMLVASRDAHGGRGVERFVYAASSSTYGDHPDLPKVEAKIGKPLSPYAVTKYVNELYAEVFASTYGLNSVGLRYFNIFGAHQDPGGAYAAVIPKWIAALMNDETVWINGDGGTSRDFCYIDNAVQANLLAATTQAPGALNQVYNVAVGERTSLNDLHRLIQDELRARRPELKLRPAEYRDFRAGDVRHSLADISKARRLLGYQPSHTLAQGLKTAMYWYVKDLTTPRRQD